MASGELRDRTSSFSGTAEAAAVQRMSGLARVSLSRVVREGDGGGGGRQYSCASGTVDGCTTLGSTVERWCTTRVVGD